MTKERDRRGEKEEGGVGGKKESKTGERDGKRRREAGGTYTIHRKTGKRNQ